MIVARCSTQYIDDSLSFTVLDFPFVSMVGGTSPLRTDHSYILGEDTAIRLSVFRIYQLEADRRLK
jgi:hypothetical protein